jgi:hypothetical protein
MNIVLYQHIIYVISCFIWRCSRTARVGLEVVVDGEGDHARPPAQELQLHLRIIYIYNIYILYNVYIYYI